MAEERRNQRPARDGGRKQSPSGGSGRPSGSGERTERGASSDRPGSGPRRDERRGAQASGRPARSNDSRGADSRGRPSRDGGRDKPRDSDRSDNRENRPRRTPEEQAAYDGPELPTEVTGRELDKAIASQLKALPEKLANRVARHLVAAGMVIDEDPETAFQHARAARIRAPRIAVVREAAGEAAYAAGHYAEALSDLRAAKRMNGATAYLPIMADCHRALGHPEQALKLSKSPSVAGFAAEAKAEMTIVEAGARRDMGQLDAALRTLELSPLNHKARDAWVVRLRYAYADTLEEANRPQEAVEWFHRAHAIDSDEVTDAADRAAALEKKLDV